MTPDLVAASHRQLELFGNQAFIGGPKSGVPTKIFEAPQAEDVTEGRHLPLYYKVTPTSVEVRDWQRPNEFFFEASTTYGLLCLDLRTRNDNNSIPEHHPDLNAKYLLYSSLSHFERYSQVPRVIRGKWAEYSDNYQDFKANHNPFMTWTGSRAAELGYCFAEIIPPCDEEDDYDKGLGDVVYIHFKQERSIYHFPEVVTYHSQYGRI